MTEDRLTDEEEAELEGLHRRSEEHQRKEVWLMKTDGYYEIVERDSIESILPKGCYHYIMLYKVSFKDGTSKDYMIDYHTIRTAAEKYQNQWAIPVFKTSEPLHQAWLEANILRKQTNEQDKDDFSGY